MLEVPEHIDHSSSMAYVFMTEGNCSDVTKTEVVDRNSKSVLW